MNSATKRSPMPVSEGMLSMPQIGISATMDPLGTPATDTAIKDDTTLHKEHRKMILA